MKAKQVWLLFILAAVSFKVLADHASVGFGVGSASPINTESGVPLPENKWATGVRLEHIQFDEYSDSELRHLRERDPEADLHSVDTLNQVSVGVAYGITDNFTVGVRLPIVMRNNIREPEHGHGFEEVDHGNDHDNDHEEENEHAEDNDHDEGPEPINIATLGDVDGIGDAVFFGQYRFLQHEGSHLSALFGVKTPTGVTSRTSDQGTLLEVEFQPGSGSWDGLMGFAFTQELGDFNFDSNILYSVVTEGTQDTNLGDIFSYNFALSYRLFGQEGSSYMPPDYVFELIGEVNGEWREKEERAGIVDDNSGGNLVYLSPGIRFTAKKRANIAFSFGIPVVRGVNGDQVKPDYRIISTFNVNF